MQMISRRCLYRKSCSKQLTERPQCGHRGRGTSHEEPQRLTLLGCEEASMPSSVCLDGNSDAESHGGDVERDGLRKFCRKALAHIKVRRGWAGTEKEWRQHFVQPIAEGHRHDAAIGAHTLSIVREPSRLPSLTTRCGSENYIVKSCLISTCAATSDLSLTRYVTGDQPLTYQLPIKRDLIVLCPLGKQQSLVYQRVINSPGKEPCLTSLTF